MKATGGNKSQITLGSRFGRALCLGEVCGPINLALGRESPHAGAKRQTTEILINSRDGGLQQKPLESTEKMRKNYRYIEVL